MKKTKKKLALTGLISAFVVAVSGAFVGCSLQANYDVLPEEGLYEYNFNQPFTAKPDAYMHLDGKFEEELWQNKKWLESSNRDTSMRATTAFTSEGLYVGLEVFDTNITWLGRNNFKETGTEKTSSFFKIQIIKSGTVQTNDRMRDVMLYMDCQSICSHRERQVAAGCQLIGEINSGATTSLSGEIFVPWSELSYTEEELNQYGYPQDIQMDVKYLRVFDGESGNNFTVKSSPLQSYTFTSYPYYNENGLVGTYDCEEFGSAINGAPATDKWEIEQDENGKVTKLITTVDRAQTIFFRQNSEGEAMSGSSDFLLETRVEILPLAKDSVPVCGLWIGSYLVTGVRGDKLYGGELMLQNSKSISDAQWMGEPQDYTIKNTVESNYDKGYVDLRIVKRGTEIYYFYNDIFYKVETRSNFEGAISVGLFANGKAEFTNFQFVDYSERVDELTEYLSNYVYYVNVKKGTAKGSVTSDVTAVKKGEPLTLQVLPGLECYLTEFTVNGTSQYFDVEEGLDKNTGAYTFIPTEDVDVSYKFDYLDGADVVNVFIGLSDKDTEEGLGGAEFRLTSDSSLVYYVSSANDRGYINMLLPKAGAEIGSKAFEGKYQLYFEIDGYNPNRTTFEIPADAQNIQLTVEAEKVRYGSTVVNGLETKDVNGKPSYDIDKDSYYMPSGNVTQYFLDKISTEENDYNYVVEAEIKVSPVAEGKLLDDNSNGVSGIVISSGKTGSIILKQTSFSWEINRICLQLGDHELSIGGFNHTLGENGGIIKIKAVRYENKIYVFDAEGDLGFYLDADGLHLVGDDHTLKSSQLSRLESVNNMLRAFFERGAENVIGLVNFDKVKAEYDITLTKGSEAAEAVVPLSSFEFDIESQEYLAEVIGSKVGEKYVNGSSLQVVCEAKGDLYAKTLTLYYASGAVTVNGSVNGERVIFEFIISEDCEAEITEYVYTKEYSGKIKGATSNAVLSLYGFDGEFIQDYSNLINDDGTYALTLIESEYNIVVREGKNIAFLDAGESNTEFTSGAYVFDGGSVNGVEYEAVKMNYFEVKSAAEGVLVPPETKKQMMLTSGVTNGDFSYRVAVNTRNDQGFTSAPNNTAGTVVALTSGEYSVRFERQPSRTLYISLYRGNNRLSMVTFEGISDNDTYLTVSTKDSSKISTLNAFGNISDGSGSSYSYGFEKRNGAIYVSLGRADDNMFEIFKITERGIEAASGEQSHDGINTQLISMSINATQQAALNKALAEMHNVTDEDFKNAFASFFGEYEVSVFVTSSKANTPFTFSALQRKEVGAMVTLSGKVTGATSSAMLNVYDGNGAFVESYSDVFDENGNYTVKVEDGTYNLIAREGLKLAFIDKGQKNGEMAEANVFGVAIINATEYGSNTLSYQAMKAAATGNQVSPTYAGKNAVWVNSVTNGNYAYRVAVNTRPDEGITGAPTSTNGAMVSLTSGAYSISLLRYGPRQLVMEIYKGSTKLYSKTFSGIADSTTYLTMTSTNTSITSAANALGNISDGSGSNYAYGFEKKADGIYISLGRENSNMFEIFKITANGIEAADGTKVYMGRNDVTSVTMSETQKTALNDALGTVYNTVDEELLKAFASFFNGENAVAISSAVENTPFTVGNLA